MNPKKQKLLSTITYYLALLGLGMTTVTIGPTLPGLAEQTGVTIGDISILFTFKEVGHLIGALVLVQLLDKMNGNKALGAFLLIAAFLLIFFPFIPQLYILAALILVLGIFASGVDSGTNTLLLWLYKEKSAAYLNGLHLMFGLGGLAAPLVFAAVLEATGDIDWVFWIVALMLVPGGLLAFTLPAPQKPDAAAVSSNGKGSGMLIFIIAGFFFAYVAAEVAFTGWIYTYSVQRELADEIFSAYLNSGFWGALTIGRLVSIPLANKFSSQSLMRINFMGTAISMLVLIVGQNEFWLVMLGCIGLGLSAASMFPTMMAIANQKMVITARIGGLFVAGAAAGGMSLPWIVGQLFDSTGPSMLFYVVGLLFLLTYAFYQAAVKRKGVSTGV